MEIRTGVRAAAAAALLALPLRLPAQAPDPGCAELGAIVAAAQEEPSFVSMPSATVEPHLGFAHCELLDAMTPESEGGTPSFVCLEDDPHSVRRWEALNADILRCLPGAQRYEDPRWTPPTPPDRVAHFRAGRARIDTFEAGYANLPQRYVAIHVEAEREE